MSELPTDFQLAQRLLRSIGGFTELVQGSGGIVIVAARVAPDPGNQPLKRLDEDLSLTPDTRVRTRLVFDNDGALVPDECIINRKIARV